MHLVASGAASVEDVFGSRATASFRFQVIGVTIISDNLDVNGDSPPTPGAFTIDQTPSVPVGTVVLVGMAASASMNVVNIGSPMTGNAQGTINPLIEIPDETIPGTTSSYRDFFAIEFSEGYDAQTPVQRITLSELKRRFGTGR